MSKLYRILSIDGGGIRGVIPAKALVWLEEHTGRPISELFDLIAGTSTGGILAAGLSLPDTSKELPTPRYSAKDMLDLYKNQGKRIFGRPANFVESFIRAKFPNEDIERVLRQYFGDTKLSEALTGLLITSYEIEHRTDFFFNSFRAKEKPDYDFLMRDVARATSAAPVFFKPHIIQRKDPPLFVHKWSPDKRIFERKVVNRYALVDGGVFANNPTVCAYVEGVKQFQKNPDLRRDKSANFLIVSLGTGRDTGPIPYKDVSGSSYSWVRPSLGVPIISSMFHGMGEVSNVQMRTILNSFDDQDIPKYQSVDDLVNADKGIYLRVDVPLPAELAAIDEPRNFSALAAEADKMISEVANQLKAISTLLLPE